MTFLQRVFFILGIKISYNAPGILNAYQFASLNRAITRLATEDKRELKNYDDDFVDDDRK